MRYPDITREQLCSLLVWPTSAARK